MKKHIFIALVALGLISTGCSEAEISDNYSDPNLIGETTVPKQFTGMLFANANYVLPNYGNYFIIARPTLLPWTQAAGWLNSLGQYKVGAATVDEQWNQYYSMLAQYRELQKVYNASSAEDQKANKIFMQAATIYLYDHTQDMVDLFGYIPFSEAGKLSTNGGDYIASLPAYDSSTDLYAMMLDDLKIIADELNSTTLDALTATIFTNQDYVNHGDLTLWKKYCNSLRLRLLNRVSGTSQFSSRADSEIGTILGSSTYPVVDSNNQNIQIEVVNVDSPINSRGFDQGFGSDGWYTNFAGKLMVDHMSANNDPRQRVYFEEIVGGGYAGIDPMANPTTQQTQADNGAVSLFSRSTFNLNQFFPGQIIDAAEVNFLKAEYYLRNSNDAMAKAAYEMGIAQSIEWYYWVRSITNNNISGEVTPLGATEVADYIAGAGIAWAGTADDKLELIATQKWIHYGVINLRESWAEQRRLDLPELTFMVDNSDVQSLPPVRWIYPDKERALNTENFSAVSSMDNMTTRIFWDAN
ncbi:SusD/RagB family nutrient-binding outer membrane lipoprotein [Aestuariibaculum suncheonense]|uniref:SusD/RagB family nutrient-binding outer membrane lipoprotein n=1 Tax=Aestuariibaculum suncheonense TaxID=1028745 RepID=A0A8J6QTZ6_9FLAO|nr:SusD/RagB family nutrient-binding outer membrane lipoprotein [Aestuariibaculum suncheonense]MBD0835554.1 SusD/RagB family nutrient-binding outer membrane lipoprotein [Aestuariibaculum suncheonense]